MKVCVFGNIGSGKTTLIDLLKKALNWNVVAIDDFRRQYGSGTDQTELIARENFISSIKPNTNQLIECTGIGQVADLMFNKLAKFDEKVLCIVLTTSVQVCKSRLKDRCWDIPFPKALENVPSLMEKIQWKSESGEIELKCKALNNCILIERMNSTETDKKSILAETLSLITSLMLKPDAIELMLSEGVQGYYGSEYLSYQSQVINRNDRFVKDKEMISEFIRNQRFKGNLLDIGAGSCQWFQFLEKTIDHYYAIDANKKALEKSAKTNKLTTIDLNIFDTKFNLNTVIKKPINCLLFSFFLSHFSDDQIINLLRKLGNVNQIIIIDSFWGDYHKRKYVSKELNTIQRKTSQETVIDLPKRFFDINSLEILANKASYEVDHTQTGNYWFVCLLKNIRES